MRQEPEKIPKVVQICFSLIAAFLTFLVFLVFQTHTASAEALEYDFENTHSASGTTQFLIDPAGGTGDMQVLQIWEPSDTAEVSELRIPLVDEVAGQHGHEHANLKISELNENWNADTSPLLTGDLLASDANPTLPQSSPVMSDPDTWAVFEFTPFTAQKGQAYVFQLGLEHFSDDRFSTPANENLYGFSNEVIFRWACDGTWSVNQNSGSCTTGSDRSDYDLLFEFTYDVLPSIELTNAAETKVGGIQTFFAACDWQGFSPSRRWVSAVRKDDWWPTVRYGYNDYGPFASPGSYNSLTSQEQPQYLPNGDYKITCHGLESGGIVHTDTTDITVDGNSYTELTLDTTPVDEFTGDGPIGWDDTETGFGFDQNASLTEQLDLNLVIDDFGTACTTDQLTESATSVRCVFSNENNRLFSYPLFTWIVGIFQAYEDAYDATRESSTAYELEIIAPDGTASEYVPAVTFLDSASNTKGVGYWFYKVSGDPDAILKWRPWFVFFVWFAFVWGVYGRAKTMIKSP